MQYTSQWPAAFEVVLIFYLGDRPTHQTPYSSSAMVGKDSYLVGPVLYNNGSVEFNGRYHTFIIEFKSDGLNKIFGISPREITNRVLDTENVFGSSAIALNEALLMAKTTEQMATIADNFLLSALHGRPKYSSSVDPISYIMSCLNEAGEFRRISEYAAISNMSLRSFERKFTNQIGISPKQYIQLSRFEKVLKMKIVYPNKSWTAIAHDCGYYDQMHMIRNFKQFTNRNPSAFFAEERVFTRSCVNIFDYDHFKNFNGEVAQEKFVHLGRSIPEDAA